MSDNKSKPGVSRLNRISDEGLQRLDKLLSRGDKISKPVLAQWIRRYGDQARQVIKHHGSYSDELD